MLLGMLRVKPKLLVSILPLVVSTGNFPTVPPDTSLATLPVLYYGANWNRSEENIEGLAKMHIVVLMQEDGPCWLKCCPQPGPGLDRQCGALHNATALLGCSPECDQHGWQISVCERIKLAARRQGRRDPHCMLYMNSVYDFPFDKTHALGDEIDVLDISGKPHMESIDPGLYPVAFFDFGRKAGQDAWLSIVNRAVVEGAADGIYVDCYQDVPFKCKPNSNVCAARRNGHMASINEVVTRAQADAYAVGKNSTLRTAAEMVGPNGSIYAKQYKLLPPKFGGNMVWIKQDDVRGLLGPGALIQAIRTAFGWYKYIVVGGPDEFSNPMANETLESHCDESEIAQFLLAMEPGCFILCNGWDPLFDRPLGQPLGPASFNEQTKTWSRSFEHGTRASWADGRGTVKWADAPATALTLVV